MQMEEGLDTGPVFLAREVPLGAEDTAGTLTEKLGGLAAEIVRERLPSLLAGQLTAQAQDHSRATHAPPLTREDCRIDWRRTGAEILALVRGLHPRPTAHTTVAGQLLKIQSLSATQGTLTGRAPGTLSVSGKKVLVQTGDEALALEVAQLEGRKAMSAWDLVNGRALRDGQVLGD